ncbi:tRNA uridine-5-carboxymethylaminomethyl(34) synthesis GTPase MnmE [Wolbachia endosymbiont of Carposina sasakii]|uniref:tRNA uridine-5-carboxymethylaminomethyl(34) synthesis GTPase MnmE n=1 Tax=Wolbachia TaxID=953 RepID=UPI0002D256EC|nr:MULTISPECIES: tRNA uridine-5-carboxymethylaminomethyl(34) synthesis GTPase MnmE [Wolbachia]AGK00244.1 tRNA modification GTPase MnmE [Wolbachia endosymbiont of Drosophila simulans wHa]MBH5362218.1 tRNA uridine-5-carboxymethylaminomethyl(34) synthesis GTPase MnmE [Wolbachia endosymbiont of Kradibia gibbosae]QDH18155.1 tRNA uridine-5-carboxymethylaminomethyl(34) synthesis GTPase MnmE [Wolbachia endosymbiont of Carposina sasakii]GKS80249.1 tRNA modification GTPase MnmE [Wolbachia pipientis]
MTNTNETIFALSTVFGKSGVAVIRISGNYALKALNHFHIKKEIKPRFATLVDLYDDFNQLIDNGIIIYFPAPNSFTGENVIELQVHGSKAVIKIILEELSKIFVMARPGEFSLRAFLNGKFDLTQIEGIADLIDAETKMQAKQAIKQISGELERLYSNWRQRLITIQSKIEAYIDFPEDIWAEKSELEKINNEVQSLVRLIQEHLNDNRRGERLREGLHIVITGKPNVGKSTLFNFLAKRDIAIVSEYAGTTRDILEAHIDIGGYPIILSDTAGIRESSDPIESEGISRAKKRSFEADLRIELFPFEQRHNINCNVVNSDTIYVLSKADDVINNHNIKINGIDLLPISILKEIGTNKLISLIKEKAEEKFGHDRDTPVITRQRHRNHMKKALEHLQRFNIDNPIELISEDLRLAAFELGAVIGIIDVEEILSSVFSNFCVGK